MGLHPEFPRWPYAELVPEHRWFPADETLRERSYERLIPPLVARIREEVFAWRRGGYAGASGVTLALLRWWFERTHNLERADGLLADFRYYFAQREAVETVVWLHDVRRARDKFDLLRFDASGAVSPSMFDESWPRYVVKMATGAGKTKVLSLLMAWSYFHKLYEPESTLARNFLLIAPNIIVLDRLRTDFDGLRIFFNDPILPDNGYEGRKRVLVVLFVPSVERDGATSVDQAQWVDASLEMFGRVFGGATAYPKATGSGVAMNATAP